MVQSGHGPAVRQCAEHIEKITSGPSAPVRGTDKAKTRAQLARQDSIRQARIEPTRRDWPAVRPYHEGLEHLTDSVAQNRPDPPKMDALPPPK